MTPTFLAVGHFCYDVVPNGRIIGGPAAYSAITARNLGWHARAVTAVGADFDRQDPILENIAVVYHQSLETTIFENRYGEDGRRQQFISGVARDLLPHHIPREWRHTEVVYLCPIADEVHRELVSGFEGALVGVTPQGWMRQWDESGQVCPKRWISAQAILSRADVLILSDEDIGAYPEDLEMYIQWAQIVVLTRGKHGATLYENGQILESTAYPANEVDVTGAGDVFAAAFLTKYHGTRSLWKSLNFAHCVASFAVESRGIKGIPTLDQVYARLIPNWT